jgi:hypothetical protein
MGSLQFQHYYSAPDASFWQAFSEYKLNVAQLNEEETTIWGYYFPGEGTRNATGEGISPTELSLRPYMYVDEQSFHSNIAS